MKLLTTFQIVDTIRYIRESEIYNASDVYIYIYIYIYNIYIYNLLAQRFNSNTAWFNFQTHIYI